MRTLIILFAKAPVPGKVKTRLIPRLGAEQALRLHLRLVQDVWDRCLTPLAAANDPQMRLELHTDSATDAWPLIDLTARRLQLPDTDLGARLLHALQSGLAQGFEQVLIVGGDIPGLPPELLTDLLERPESVALGPVRDGGYYAIKARQIDARMFNGVRWSSEFACRDTVGACEACDLTVSLGAPWYDLDTPEDFDTLPESVRQLLAGDV